MMAILLLNAEINDGLLITVKELWERLNDDYNRDSEMMTAMVMVDPVNHNHTFSMMVHDDCR